MERFEKSVPKKQNAMQEFGLQRFARGPSKSRKGAKPATVSQVRQMITARLGADDELKYYTTSDTGTSVGFSGTLSSISNPPQGNTDVTRVGDALRLKEVGFRYNFTFGDNIQVCRMILFQWIPNSVPTVTNILLAIGTALAPLSPYNVDTEAQYKILYDKIWYLNNVANPQNGEEVLITKGFNQLQDFFAGGTTGSNQIYKLFISDSGAAPNPSLNSESIVRYTDA